MDRLNEKMMRNKLLVGDVRQRLQELPDQSVHCCITSPPYWGLRDYGEAGQIGLEQTPDDYVTELLSVFREVWRVLRDDGTLWLNLGDSYATISGGMEQLRKNKKETVAFGAIDYAKGYEGVNQDGKKQAQKISGLKHKDMVGIPFRVAFALQADGWYLRQDIIWHKPNPMPESVSDRCTKSHEYIFLLSKSEKYFFDNEAIKEPSITWNPDAKLQKLDITNIKGNMSDRGVTRTTEGLNMKSQFEKTKQTRNKRDVWSVPVRPFKDAHFATFPTTLIEPCVLAGTSAHGVCASCGKPFERIMIKGETPERKTRDKTLGAYPDRKTTSRLNSVDMVAIPKIEGGWKKMCSCESNERVPAIVLDPFFGAGTTGLVAQSLKRDWVGCELNPIYAEMALKRIQDNEPMPQLFDE